MSVLEEVLGIGAGAALVKAAYDRLGSTGDKAFGLFSGGYIDPETKEAGESLATTLRDMLAFEPYSIYGSTDSGFEVTENDQGEFKYDLKLGATEDYIQDTALDNAKALLRAAGSDYYMDPETGQVAGRGLAGREQDVLDRLRALRNPEIERQRQDMEQRLAAQGRLGTRTSMFGGTPEQLAFEKALLETEASDIIKAMEYAAAEKEGQIRMGQQLLETAYMPVNQLMLSLEPGMTAAERRREAVSEQAQTFGETYAAGIEALLSSAIGQADLLGQSGSGLISGGAKGLFSL